MKETIIKIGLVLISLFFISCSKLTYIVKQSAGQVGLEWNGIKNSKALESNEVSEKHKSKIRVVLKAKKYFYNYFQLEPTAIYEQTTFLDQEAVSYLVIHSPENEIKAVESSFPIVGTFPYIGFFSKNDANEYKEELEKQKFHTYMRPVFAYSTLNHPLLPFDDNILSSFFYFKDKSLIELIFHELVHTIVFVKDNVQFNENFAQFVAEELIKEYLSISSKEIDLEKERMQKQLKLNQKIVTLSKELQSLYKSRKGNEPHPLDSFLAEKFIPTIKGECEKLEFKKCWPLKEKWNNARFAALGTYEEKRNEIKEVFIKSDMTLKSFVKKVISLEEKFEDGDGEDFISFLKRSI